MATKEEIALKASEEYGILMGQVMTLSAHAEVDDHPETTSEILQQLGGHDTVQKIIDEIYLNGGDKLKDVIFRQEWYNLTREGYEKPEEMLHDEQNAEMENRIYNTS